MVGPMVELPADEQTPEARAEKYFKLVGKNKDTDTLTLEDFKRIGKQDSAIQSALNSYQGLV